MAESSEVPGGEREAAGVLTPPDEIAAAPRRVGHYQIVRQIGRGGMAIVYLARQQLLDRGVALKELSSFHTSAPGMAERFLREARLASLLNHPNIVTVHEYFEQGGVPYIAMEYAPRGSFRQYVHRISFAQFVGAMEGVLAGLAHAKEFGIVHRDLKPENIMVSSEGRVKIADFGIAKATQSAATALLTATGMTVGTPSYMAPEQAMGEEVGVWTDLYSVGVMAWEHFVGRLPFTGPAPMAILIRQVNERIPPASEENPEVDPSISAWIDRLLVKDPGERTRSPSVAWEELEEIVIGKLGARWRREARLPSPSQVLDTPPPLTPAPFESDQRARGTRKEAQAAATPGIGADEPPPEPGAVAEGEVTPEMLATADAEHVPKAAEAESAPEVSDAQLAREALEAPDRPASVAAIPAVDSTYVTFAPTREPSAPAETTPPIAPAAPPVDDFPVGTEAAGLPGVAAPDTAAAETPVIETPVVETPVVETPVVETPVIETPVIETPVVETPVIETPVIETGVIETGVIETPLTVPPPAGAPPDHQSPRVQRATQDRGRRVPLRFALSAITALAAAVIAVVLVVGHTPGGSSSTTRQSSSVSSTGPTTSKATSTSTSVKTGTNGHPKPPPVTAGDPAPQGALAAINQYWNDIATGAYGHAYDLLEPGTVPQSESEFIALHQQENYQSVDFKGSLTSGTRGATATVGLDSLRIVSGQYGCQIASGGPYSLTYTGGTWLITGAPLSFASCS